MRHTLYICGMVIRGLSLGSAWGKPWDGTKDKEKKIVARHPAKLHNASSSNGQRRYCQLKPNLAPSTRGASKLVPDKSMDYSQVNCLLSVQFSLS